MDDVPFDHWAYDACDMLAEEGIIVGYPDGTFKGNRALTRYEFAIALARLLEWTNRQVAEGQVAAPDVAGSSGPPGPEGERGPVGPTGPQGPAPEAVAQGLTEDQVREIAQALIDEFRQELQNITGEVAILRSDLAELTARVEALEERVAATVTGDVEFRVGLAGGSLGHFDDFDATTARIYIDAPVNEKAHAHVALHHTDSMNPQNTVNRLDEGYLEVGAPTFGWTQWRVGQQYMDLGNGIAFDNQQFPSRAVFAHVRPESKMQFWGIWGETGMQTHDSLEVVRAQWSPNDAVTVAGNYVSAGFRGERLWAVDADLRLAGRNVTVAYGNQTRDLNWSDVDGKALMIDAELIDTPNVTLTGRYALVGVAYNPNLSILNPYWEQYDPDMPPGVGFFPWEWALSDRFMANNIRLYGGILDWRIGDVPVHISYTNVRNRNGNARGALDAIYSVGASKEVMPNINVGLTYGVQKSLAAGTSTQRLVKGDMSFEF